MARDGRQVSQRLRDITSSLSQGLLDGSLPSRGDLERSLIQQYGLGEASARDASRSILRAVTRRVFPPVTDIELFLTENCPLRCDHCFVTEKDDFHRMPLEVATRSLDFLIQESRTQEQLHVLFFGGEPLLEFELIAQVVRYAESKGKGCGKQFHFSLTTNGVLLTEKPLRFFRDHNVKFLLSLDGDRDSHDKHRKTRDGRGTFDIIDANLPLMKSYQPWIGARMTIHSDTVDQLASNVRFLAGKGINQFLIAPIEGAGVKWSSEAIAIYWRELMKVLSFYGEQIEQGTPIRMTFFEKIEARDFFEKRDRWGCRAGRHSLTISPEGDILPCSRMIQPADLRSRTQLGSLNDGITNLKLRLQLNDLVPVDRGDCWTCQLTESCTGGCFATNYLATGNLFKPSATGCQFAEMISGVAHALREQKREYHVTAIARVKSPA